MEFLELFAWMKVGDVATLSLVLLLGMFALLAIGMPLGFASAILAVLVIVMKFGPETSFGRFGSGPMSILAQAVYRQMTNYVLISVPLFIFMAALLERSGIARDMYNSLNQWLSRMRGGIAVVTSIMAVIMAAMSGIIGGEVVLLGLIALPQMLRLNYNQNLAIGTICASGSLGTMIPPSIVLIFYGLVTETSIKALFTASFLPGFMLASFFIVYIIIRVNLNHSLAPLPKDDPSDPKGSEKGLMFLAFLGRFAIYLAAAFVTLFLLISLVRGGSLTDDGVTTVWQSLRSDIVKLLAIGVGGFVITLVVGKERAAAGWDMGKGLIAPVVVVGVVLGSIYGGITGITEAAAMGVVAVFAIGFIRREMTFDIVWDSLMRTLKSTGTIIWVTIGAAALAAAYTLAGGPTYVANLIVSSDLPTMGIILVMMVIFLIMGMFMDWVGIVLLIMPVFLPIVLKLPVEEIGLVGTLEPKHVAIWFGVVFCMNMQVSFLSPPFGPAAFYLKSVAPSHITLIDIFRGFLPFICLQLLALSVLLIWPPIVAVWL